MAAAEGATSPRVAAGDSPGDVGVALASPCAFSAKADFLTRRTLQSYQSFGPRRVGPRGAHPHALANSTQARSKSIAIDHMTCRPCTRATRAKFSATIDA